VAGAEKLMLERIEANTTVVGLEPEDAERYLKLRTTAKEMARLILELCPAETMARASAISYIEQALNWTHAAIRIATLTPSGR
jgi:hypothetical protein